jgi:hypothetical protein
MPIRIQNQKIEKRIDEILKRTKYSDPLEYIEHRIKQDYESVIKNKKLI